MDKVTQSNAANAEESASAAEELTVQARSLDDAVASLLEVVGGSLNPQPMGRTAAPASPNHPLKTPVIRPAARATMPGNGASHPRPAKPVSVVAHAAGQKTAIPMEGDFKNF
jgi:methyl-accepting chemotaxis protein